MKKFIKITLVTLASLFIITVASSFVASVSEDSICIESVDDMPLNLNLSSVQLHSMYDILPDQYRKILDSSYERFCNKALVNGYKTTIFVDGLKMYCSQTEDGDLYTISGNFEGFGYHKVNVLVGSRLEFIDWMDNIILR